MEGAETGKQSVEQTARPGWKTNLMRGLALLFVIALTATLIFFRDQLKDLEGYGYPGIFLVSLLSNATIILPLPGVLFTSAMGAVFNPFWVALAASAGAALGEVSGYLAGFSGQGVVQRVGVYQTLEGWIKKYGFLAIFVLGVVPNPLFDMAGMIAGALRMRFLTFLFWCWLGKFFKMLAFAYAGAAGGSLLPYFQ